MAVCVASKKFVCLDLKQCENKPTMGNRQNTKKWDLSQIKMTSTGTSIWFRFLLAHDSDMPYVNQSPRRLTVVIMHAIAQKIKMVCLTNRIKL